MEHINWAVLGCGHIAETFVSSMAFVNNASIEACAASHSARAQSFANKHNIPKYFGTYADMLQQRSIHAVYIATTHNFHFEHIKLCLHHGKHVLCEKPLTLNEAQAKEVYELAKAHNLLLIEAVWTRFLPAIQSMQKVIAAGEIGDIVAIQANFSLNRDLPDTHRLNNKKLAGGALLDLGIYPLTIADIVFGKMPTGITSSAQLTNTSVDKNSFYTLQYECGAVAQLSSGFNMSGPTYAHIFGSKGSIYVPFFLGAQAYEITIEGQAAKETECGFSQGQNFAFEIQHFTDVLMSESVGMPRSQIMPPETTLRVMKIMDQIRQQWGLVYPDEM